MPKKTEAQLLEAEGFDKAVYSVTRAGFKHMLFSMVQTFKDGGDWVKEADALVELYNHTSEDCQRMVGLNRRLENEKAES